MAFIALSNVWDSEPHRHDGVYEKRTQVHVNGWPDGGVSFTIEARVFEVKYDERGAHIALSHDLTTAQMRELAAALLKEADEGDLRRKQWSEEVEECDDCDDANCPVCDREYESK